MRYVAILNVVALLSISGADNIHVGVFPGVDVNETSVFVVGCDSARAAKMDLETFELNEKKVRQNLKKLNWYKVDDLIINNVNRYQDLRVQLQPAHAKVLRTKERIIKLSDKSYLNRFSNTRKFRPALKQYVAHTMKTKWYDSSNISVGSNISHSCAKTEYTAAYGHDDTVSKVVVLKAKSPDLIVLEYRDQVKASLLAKETTIEVMVDYEVTVHGHFYFGIYCTYIFKICPKHVNMDVNEYFRRLHYPPMVKSYEIITFKYYHDPQVKVWEVHRPVKE